MKKIFLLTCLLIGTVSMQAQDKKTWDFTKGLSSETVANLNADGTNWGANGTDGEGVTNNWQNLTKQAADAEWTANGEVIAELSNLLIDIGSNKSNSIHLAQNKIRLTRKGTKITFPQLENGQKITIVGRSANGTATNRGIAPLQDYLELVDGVTTDGACIFNGNQVDGSLGTYSFTWEVKTTESGPVDVQFQLTPEGGIDFTLFMIDEGDVPETISVAYLYDGNDDIVLNYLNARDNTSVTAINVTTETVTAEQLQQYQVTIVGGSVPADNAAVQVVKDALPWTPTLNLNGALYPAWTYGTAVDVSGFAKIKQAKNSLFSGVDYETSDEGNVIVMSASGFETTMKAVTLGDYFDGDVIAAVSTDDESAVTVHTHNINHNGYVYMPYVADYTDAALALFDNALLTLAASKKDITPAVTPGISREYKDNLTIVTITGANQPKTVVYYTTDGSDPTTDSNVYTEPLQLTSPCTVKAAAIAEGYLLSAVASLDIDIKQQPATPVISYVQERAKTTITLSGDYSDDADVVIWYNFEGITDTIKSARYTEPFVIEMPQNVTAFAVAGEAVWSEPVTERVLVKHPRVVIDVAGHFKADKWDDVANGGGVFSNGKTALSMYDSTQDPVGTYVDPETGDEETLYPEVEWMTRDEPGDNPEWQIMSKGQSVLWQNLGASTDKVGTNEGGYYPSASEDIDPLFPITKNDIQFYQIYAGEPANAAIQSKNKYKGPLDIVTFANMQGGPLLVQISPDGESWTTLGDEIEKTGYTRMWKKYTRQCSTIADVYVRVIQQTGTFGSKIFDIYIANEGEQSKALLEELKAELGEDDDIVGDVNGDGSVDVADISGILSVMASGGYDSKADVNTGEDGTVGDGAVDVADISAVLTIMAANARMAMEAAGE